MHETKPSNKELEALHLFYNRFYDLYEEISEEENFIEKAPQLRFCKIKEIFSVYKELMSYEPVKFYLKHVKKSRPPIEGIIAEDLFSFVRNLLMHFPIFDTWDQVYITKNLATWNKAGSIDKFLSKCTEIKIDKTGTVKYRIWEKSKKKMTYIKINFPELYDENNRIYLKDVISEKDGIKFSISLMKQILDTQIVDNRESDIVIMSQVYIPRLATN